MSKDEFDVETIAGISYIHIDSRRIGSCLQYYLEHGIDWVVVNADRGYDLTNIDFLEDYPSVKNVLIVPPRKHLFNLKGLSALRDLQGLILNGAAPVSLAQFPKLRQFSGAWSEKLDLATCRHLEVLDLHYYKGKDDGVSSLPQFPLLRELGLVQSAVATLAGISRYSQLRKLKLAYLTQLRTIADVAALEGLEELDVGDCKRIEDHQTVSVLKHLRILKYNNCGQMPGVAFVNEMPALEFFSFVETNVRDGDLRPLIRLNYAGFSDKRHYSHTRQELDKLMSAHGGAAIVRLKGE